MDIAYRWTSNAYSSRGKAQKRDLMYEKIISNACVICLKTLERKKGKTGKLETIQQFINRKTCGKILIDGIYKKGACLKQYLTGKTNPNYRGKLPKCIDCGKKVSYYTIAENKITKRCRKCYVKWWPDNMTQGQKDHLKKIQWKKGQKAVGNPWQKGHIPWNKKFDFCTLPNCESKHLAKGFCNKHYLQNKKIMHPTP